MKSDIEEKFQQAQIAYKNGEPQKTVNILEPLCDDPVSIQINVLYVQALLKVKQYHRAYTEAINYELQYLKNREYFEVWIDVLLDNELFIPARLSVVNYQKIFGQDKVYRYLKMIEQKEDLVASEQANTVKQNLKNFYHLGDQPSWNQQQVLNSADHLPLSQYVIGAQFILRDPFVKPLIRATILNTLLDLQYSKSIAFIWIDNEEHSIIPNKVNEKSREEKIKELREILKERLANDNPIDYENYSQQLQIQLLLLAPFECDIITDSKGWIDILVNNPKANQDNDVEIIKMKNWQQKIQSSLL